MKLFFYISTRQRAGWQRMQLEILYSFIFSIMLEFKLECLKRKKVQ